MQILVVGSEKHVCNATDLLVENRQFVPTHPHSTPSLGVTPFEFWDERDIPRN